MSPLTLLISVYIENEYDKLGCIHFRRTEVLKTLTFKLMASKWYKISCLFSAAQRQPTVFHNVSLFELYSFAIQITIAPKQTCTWHQAGETIDYDFCAPLHEVKFLWGFKQIISWQFYRGSVRFSHVTCMCSSGKRAIEHISRQLDEKNDGWKNA